MPPSSPPADEPSASDLDSSPSAEDVGRSGARRPQMGWGLAKSRSMQHLGQAARSTSMPMNPSFSGSGAKHLLSASTSASPPLPPPSSFRDRENLYFSQYGHSHQQLDRQPAVRTTSQERVGVVDIREEDEEHYSDDLLIFDGPRRRAYSDAAHASAFGIDQHRDHGFGSGSGFAERPATRWRPEHQRSAEAPMLETSEEEIEDEMAEHDLDPIYSDEDEESDGNGDVDLNDVRALLDAQVESADQQQQYRQQQRSSLTSSARRPSDPMSMDDDLLVLEDLLDPHNAFESSLATPTQTMTRRNGEESGYGGRRPSLRPSLSLDRLRTLRYAEYRHARLFDHESDGQDHSLGAEQVRDDRSSPILGVTDDEDATVEDAIAAGDTRDDGHSDRPLGTPVDDFTSPRVSTDSMAYMDDGGSSIRVSEDNASVMQEFEMVSPPPPPYNSRFAGQQLPRTPTSISSQRSDRSSLRNGVGNAEGSRPSSAADSQPARFTQRHSHSASLSSAITSSSAQQLPHLRNVANGSLNRSSSLTSSNRPSPRSATQQLPSRHNASSPSPPPSFVTGSSRADRLRRRVSESSLRSAVRRFTTLDFFASATPRTSSPLASRGGTPDGHPLSEIPEGKPSDSRRTSSDRHSLEWPRQLTQSPTSLGSSGDRQRQSLDGSVIDIRDLSSPVPDGESELESRTRPSSDALAQYYEGTWSSESPYGSPDFHPSGSTSSRPVSSISSLRAGLTSVADVASPNVRSNESELPSIISSPPRTARDSVLSTASPNQFPRPFQNRPPGQYHLPWSHSGPYPSIPPPLAAPPPSVPLPPTPSSPGGTGQTLTLPGLPSYPSSPTTPNTAHSVSTKVLHAPSGTAIMLRLPRQTSLRDFKEKTRLKFRDAEDLDVCFRDEATNITSTECDDLHLYHRKIGGTGAQQSSQRRSRSASVSSSGTGNEGGPQIYLRIHSDEEFAQILNATPSGEKLVLRLVSATENGAPEVV